MRIGQLRDSIVGRGLSNIPNAPVLPYVGAVRYLREDPVRWLYAWFRELGDVYQFSVGAERHVIVSSPELVEQILKGNYNDWRKNDFYDPLKLMLGSGLLTSEGQQWHTFRRLAQPAFHRQRLARYVDDMATTTQTHLDSWAAGPETLDVSYEFMSLTLAVIARLMFGTDLRDEVQVVGTSLATMLEYVQVRSTTPVKLPLSWPTPRNRRARHAVRQCHDIIDRIVAQRQATKAPTSDLLELLTSARDKDTGEGLTPTELRDQAITILMAGHETTALTLGWCIELLARHPGAQARLE
ncbi:MAG TPA: cytochrome P450, partial [Polyangiaceae bacterium]|nr:cytochrome P450 [Polyangiaceae bacterium]